jgi:hypothetical protein
MIITALERGANEEVGNNPRALMCIRMLSGRVRNLLCRYSQLVQM